MRELTDVALLHLADGLREVVEVEDVYYLEADGDETLVRLRGRRVRRDVRRLGDLAAIFERRGFLRIHRSTLVNLRKIRLIRRRGGQDWEVKLTPPVNRVLAVSRSARGKLLGVLEGT